MNLETLIRHYFGTDDLDAITEDALTLGKEKLAVDFGVERDAGRKFALWTLMDGLGIAPLPAEAFEKAPALRRAAEDYLDAAWKLERD
ncbi:hypothetical protein TPR58_13705 [Sphingomonas sp. HF-S3]|uniref:Uncharacterized protein n=1 Tax=Sphingomonas rustica TaxID=3103142 RepID=A0ABV0BC92_9SPHN